jgi:hypothetical protein
LERKVYEKVFGNGGEWLGGTRVFKMLYLSQVYFLEFKNRQEMVQVQ